MPTLVAGRYRVLRAIGRGESRAVFAARDSGSDRDVALKVLVEPARRQALAREFALLYRLDHPHLPHVYAMGALAGELAGLPADAPFTVEELCEGVSASVWADGKSPAEIAGLGAQVAAALASLHAHGVRHGDVKPEHIIIIGDPPTLKLVDFDLAVQDRADTVSGTLRYMAPEALAGRAVVASDIYALAATLCELATGVPPSGHHGAQIHCAPLADAVASMTHPDPARRADAGQAFDLLMAMVAEAARPALAALADRTPLAAGLYGREPALVAVDETCDPARRGSRVLRVSGPPGVGKTALLREAAARAVVRGFRVPGMVRPAGPADLYEIEKLVIALNGDAQSLPAAEGADPAGVRWQRFAALADSLALTRGPLAVIFDDVPQGSPLDQFAGFLERTGEHGPALVWIQVCRGGDADVLLEPLSPADVTAMLRTARPLRPNDAQAAAAVHAATGGNPQAVMALLRALPGDALVQAAQHGTLGQNQALDQAFAEWLGRVEVRVRQLACAVALLGHEVPLAWLEQVEMLGAAARDHAPAAVEAGLLITHASVAGPALSAAGEAVGAYLRAAAPLDLVRASAASLERIGERPAALGLLLLRLNEPARAIEPLLNGARAAAAALRLHEALALYEALLSTASPTAQMRSTALFESARLLVALGRHPEALERYHAASDHAQARVGLAHALVRMGRHAQAADVLAGRGPQGEDTDEVEALRARALVLAGAYDGALRVIAEARATTAPHPRAAELTTAEALAALYGGEGTRARALVERALLEASAREDPQVLDLVRADLALVLHKTGDLHAAERVYAESLAAARAQRHLPRILARLLNLATLRQEQGRFDEALTGYQEAHQLARVIDGRRELVHIAINWANLLAHLGAYEAAAAKVEETMRLAAELGMGTEQAYLHVLAADVALGLDDLDGAERSLTAARNLFAGSLDKAGLAEIESVSAALAIRRNEPGRARCHAEAAASAALHAGRDRIEMQALLWRASADLNEPPHALDAAVAAAGRAAQLAEKRGDPDVAWLAHAAQSRLHARAGRSQEGRFHADRARGFLIQALKRVSARYERTYTAAWFRRELYAAVHASDEHPPLRDLDRLLAINRELARDGEPDRMLEKIVDAAIQLSGAERGFIVLALDGGELVIRAARNVDRASLAGAGHISRSIAIEAMEHARPVLSINAQDDERFREFLSVHNLKLRSVLCLPLAAPKGVLGALYLDNRYRVNAFSDADVAVLAAFGDQAAIALANARLVQELTRRGDELERSRAAIEDMNARLAVELAARAAEVELTRGRPPEGQSRHGMIGAGGAMQEVYRIIDRVADKDVTVTLLGESGTGKELAARALHAASPRKSGAFVSLNCAAIPATLLESELFGHERGAFTGAVRSKPGLFEVAAGGTVLLDEIGDMPLAMQVKLLRVLQQRELRRVGGTAAIAVDVRVIAASNRDLAALVRGGEFREDLWYRLNVVEIRLPPLRERREDVPLLVEHLLRKHGGGARKTVTRDALALLLDHDWPGNVRELENEIQRAVALTDGEITAEALSPKLRATAPTRPPVGSLKDAVEHCERDLITATLATHNGRVASAASALGLTRAGLYKKLHKYRLVALKDA